MIIEQFFKDRIKPLYQGNDNFRTLIITEAEDEVSRITVSLYSDQKKLNKIFSVDISDYAKLPEVDLHNKLSSLLKDYSIPHVVNVYWPDFKGVGFKLPLKYLTKYLFKIWHPFAENLYITNDDNDNIIVVHHEEFLEVWN